MSLLELDEALFLATTKALSRRQEEKFQLPQASVDHARSPYVAECFERDLGREISREEQDAIAYYVAAVHIVERHDVDTVDFIRKAAWAFLIPWVVRFGGGHGHQASRYALVDPTS